MFTIDLTLKHTPMPLSVQRKETEAAEELYQQILKAMCAETVEILELTCEKQPDKKIAVLSDHIIAVMISEKSGAAAAGRVPGFAVVADKK